MTWFDHVRCHACRSVLDPEQLGGAHRQLTCPHCGVQLDLKDLFGLNPALDDDAAPQLDLEDLMRADLDSIPSEERHSPAATRAQAEPGLVRKEPQAAPSVREILRQLRKKGD